jgi:tetratricopeptide (TPR) repeat protein
VQLNPENAISQYRLGAEYLRQGKTHDAVTHLRESYRLNPKNQSTLYSLQIALRQDGQPEEALRVKKQLAELLRGIDRESQNAFAALRLNNDGAALEKSGDLKGALEKYRAALALDPNHVGIRVNFAVALLRTGHWKDGLAELRESLRREPGNAQVQTALKDALKQAPAEFK